MTNQEVQADLVPARMINELSYCPRLFALEWLHGEWADSADTVEGRTVHRRVDDPSTAPLPEPEDDPERPVSRRSVYLSDEELGIVARIDLVEVEGGEVVPVDYKKGRPPDIPEGAWEPERVQVCAQGLLLRAHGYTCSHGMLWFAGARRRVVVPLDDALVTRTLSLRDEARRLARSDDLPPPLVSSPKCQGCSLVGICLPDEVNRLAGRADEVRPLVPARDDAIPLYVRAQGGSLGKTGDELVAKDRTGEIGRARLEETSEVVILGNVSVSTPLLRELAERDIPVAYHGFGGWYFGSFMPASGHGAISRIAQHRAAADPVRALQVARVLVRSKIKNQRVLLRRNGTDVPDAVLDTLADLARSTEEAADLGMLMGLEGTAARLYFEHFSRLLRGPELAFLLEGRNRRPPKDPVNALLSFVYAMLAREWTHVIARVGLDPYVGFLHQPRHGRPALALDLMEPFRPLVGDSAVISAINNGVLKLEDFLVHPTGVSIRDAGRTRFIQVYERRLDELATHPWFDTRLSMRRIFELQVRLLVRVLQGEIPQFPEYVVR